MANVLLPLLMILRNRKIWLRIEELGCTWTEAQAIWQEH